MNPHNPHWHQPYCKVWTLALAMGTLCSVLGACASSLLPKSPSLPTLYVLDDASGSTVRAAGVRGKVPSDLGSRTSTGAITLLINAPRAAAGFDTALMAYRRQSAQAKGSRSNVIGYFSDSAWVDTPSRMLAPLIAQAIERRGGFDAVLRAPSAGVAQWRLETQLIRLQQEFTATGSHGRVILHAILIDTASRAPLGWREFDISVPTTSDDPQGGVAAANEAVTKMLEELADFCVTTAKR